MRTIERSFTAFLGMQPSDEERQAVMRARDAIGVKENDALWPLLIVLEHYKTLYGKFPALIAKAASDVTDNAKAVAEAALKAAAARTRAELAKAVAQAALEIADRVASTKRWKWVSTTFAVAAAIFLGVGAGMYRQGFSSGSDSGRLEGYSKARDENAAASWANTPEGQLGFGLAKAGSLRELATCSGKILIRKGDACFVKIGREAVFGWKILMETKPEP